MKILVFLLVCVVLVVYSDEKVLVGKCSYYDDKYEGRKTACGLVFRQRFRYAAHYSLPFFTECIVSNHINGRTARVTIVDRGPFDVQLWNNYRILRPHKDRIIDVSKGTANILGMIQAGVVPVTVYVVDIK